GSEMLVCFNAPPCRTLPITCYLTASQPFLLHETRDRHDIVKVAPSYATGAALKSPLLSTISDRVFASGFRTIRTLHLRLRTAPFGPSPTHVGITLSPSPLTLPIAPRSSSLRS